MFFVHTISNSSLSMKSLFLEKHLVAASFTILAITAPVAESETSAK